MTERPSSRLFRRILVALYTGASYWVLVILTWILADVAGRVLLGRPFPGTAEIVAYSLPVITFLQIPHVLRAGQHLSASIIHDRLGPRGQALIGILTSLIGAALFALAAYSSWKPTLAAWTAGEYIGEGAMRIPAGPAWTVITGSCVLMAVQFLNTLVQDLQALLGWSKSSQEVR